MPEPLPALTDALPLGVVQRAARLRHWVAENAKTTRAFLKRVAAIEPLIAPLQEMSIVELPRPRKGAGATRTPTNVAPLLEPAHLGHDIGLISEAGLPAVADPGAALVRAAHSAGLRVVSLAGPSSMLLALAASGLNGQSFAFVGYLPADPAARGGRIRELEATSRRNGQTQLMIETPYRNAALLDALLAHLGATTELSVSWGLTLPSGATRTDRVAAWRARPTRLPPDVPAIFALLAT
ncbi:MAG: SAM-dependent methyltransferase [Proteobacteria bacterium]|nr:SAM-dependent methyltransferase [Pseudomonadota bacterium]